MDAAERYVKRIFDISAPLRRKSQFLFGPRMTGKSTLIEKELTENRLCIGIFEDGITDA